MGNPFKNLPQTGSRRIPSIDQFRGFAILYMALANYMGGVSIIPAWLKHAPDISLTVIDQTGWKMLLTAPGASQLDRLPADGNQAAFGVERPRTQEN